MKIPRKLSKKQPSPLLKYLLFSNICSFMHYSKLWNGALHVETTQDGVLEGMPFNDAVNICEALTT